MTKLGVPRHGPVPIGEVANPVFVRLADPLELFATRAGRFLFLAEGHELKPYLLFLADLVQIQHRVQLSLPQPEGPDADTVKRAREFGMPPLDRGHLVPAPLFDTTLDRLLSLAGDIEMPDAAAAALARVRESGAAERGEMVEAVLGHSVPIEELAEHGFVAAALQVHFTRLAARLDADSLVAVGDGVCPACGGPPVASMVVGWHGAHGARYCSCSLCSTLWNFVRIKCTLCASTKGIGYQEIDGGAGTIKAETCDNCRCYVKILQQHKDPALECLADDVASLGLDLLMQEKGYRRGGVNPFLLGY